MTTLEAFGFAVLLAIISFVGRTLVAGSPGTSAVYAFGVFVGAFVAHFIYRRRT